MEKNKLGNGITMNKNKQNYLKDKISVFMEVLMCPYEDQILASNMKVAFYLLCAANQLIGLFMSDGYDYIIDMTFLVFLLFFNIIISKKYKNLWVDVITFWIMFIPIYRIFCDGCTGEFTIILLIMYGCSAVFTLGIRDSFLINLANLAVIFIHFRFYLNSPVRKVYGENIALRFPYLYICIILIVYCLMYLIQCYWVQKKKYSHILKERVAIELKKMDEISMRVLNTMVCALDAKILGKEEHSKAVAGYARDIAEFMELDETQCEDVYIAGLLHEIGMIGIPDRLIKRKDLSESEFKIYQTYVMKSYQIIDTLQTEKMKNVAEIVLYHRENYDGTGYPGGFSGNDIPLLSRILMLADYVSRYIQSGCDVDTIIRDIKSLSGEKFDPDIAEIMIELLSCKYNQK